LNPDGVVWRHVEHRLGELRFPARRLKRHWELPIRGLWLRKNVDAAGKVLTVLIDFRPGSHFATSGNADLHPVHDAASEVLPAAHAPP